MGAMLEVQGLSKQFGGLRAVDDLSLTVDEGSIVGLIGPNGAGKTTVFNLVTGQLRPTAGDVRFKGRRTTGMPPHHLVRLGLVRTFQSTVLYSDSSVLENVLRGAAVRSRVGFWRGLVASRQAAREEREVRERALELLDFVELGPLRDELARNLPYGHQRALGVAIGLATAPALLMLDEPVAGMNPEETAHMARLITRVNARGTTIVVVEHDMSFVMQLCREIVVMNYGKKIAEGTPERIRNDPAVVAAYLGVDEDAPA
ncbi:MAG: ABC transporter ATP-binding protein [Candidatus Rokubacteria bacterium]|nr:ABC transporter ATP-binding protein [Candidatus Rokubacteria bacterium]MBI3107341.1 ABC transporter ATP-binding protein [Candidatus Rokubacteria bacterium]